MGQQLKLIEAVARKVTFEQKCMIKAHQEVIARGGSGLKVIKNRKKKLLNFNPLFDPEPEKEQTLF